MRKYLLLILVLLVIPFSVYAEECNDSKIIIKDITMKKSVGNTEEIEEASIINNKINLNAKMYEVGDSIEYTFKVKNDSSEDFYIDNNINAKHIEYTISSKDDSLKIPIGEEKEFNLTATYKEELEKTDFRSGKYDASSIVQLSVIPDSIYNPKTGSFFFKILGIILIVTCVMIFIQNKKVRLSILILVCAFIPYTSHAECKVNIGLNSNIVIGYVVPNPCTYNGNLVQGAEFTSGQYTYHYMQEYAYSSSSGSYYWANIGNDGWGVKLTDISSTTPVTSNLCTSINNKPIVSMSYMFFDSQASSIDTSSFDTSYVTNMEAMFLFANQITELDLLQFDTSNVTNMKNMFNNASSLTILDLSNFDTSHVTSMGALVYNDSSLRSINLDNFVIPSMPSGFFGSCSSLKSISARNWVLPESFAHVFFRSMSGGGSIEEIDVTGWDLSNSTDISGLFADGGGLKRIIGLDTWDTSNITKMASMFDNCQSLTSLDLSNFDTSHVTNMGSIIKGCSSLTSINMSNFDFSNVTDFNGSLFMNLTYGGLLSLKEINMTNAILPSNCNYAFGGLTSVETIILKDVDTSNVTNMQAMFCNDSHLTSLDLSDFDTSNVTIMRQMFYGNTALTTIFVSNSFTTNNVNESSDMFNGCTSLVGGNGTTFNSSYIDKTYARIDQSGSPGYFTRKATS